MNASYGKVFLTKNIFYFLENVFVAFAFLIHNPLQLSLFRSALSFSLQGFWTN